MAQHDMNIANQGFPATRADINNALQALASNNSGTSAPSTTFANQWWYDEANNKLYIRNEANNAWIQVAVLDQTNNEWQITTGVIQAKDSDGLALKTDDGTTRLFIKDSNGHIGILTSSPSHPLDVNGEVRFNSNIRLTEASSSSETGSINLSDAGLMQIQSFATGGEIAFDVGSSAAEIVRISASGLGINKTAPDAELHVRGSRPHIDIEDSSAAQRAKVGSAFDNMYMGPTATAGDIFFKTGITSDGAPQDSGNTIMTINGANQRVGIGTTGPDYKLVVSAGGMAAAAQFGRSTDGTPRTLMLFRSESAGAFVGSIQVTNSATAYNTSSDYRLKENIQDLSDGITRVKQLQPKRFNWIIDDTNTLVDGFIAHEASEVVPESVSGEKDAVMDEEYEISAQKGEIYTPATEDADEIIHSTDVECPEELPDGQRWRLTTKAVMGTRTVPDMQGIDQAKLVPLLTAALQEAIAKIDALETRVATLEG